MIANHAQTVLDAAKMRPSLVIEMARVYRELEAMDRSAGRFDLADYSAGRAAALEFGGQISLAVLVEGAL